MKFIILLIVSLNIFPQNNIYDDLEREINFHLSQLKDSRIVTDPNSFLVLDFDYKVNKFLFEFEYKRVIELYYEKMNKIQELIISEEDKVVVENNKLLSAGYSSKMIAERLKNSNQEIQSYITSIFNHLFHEMTKVFDANIKSRIDIKDFYNTCSSSSCRKKTKEISKDFYNSVITILGLNDGFRSMLYRDSQFDSTFSAQILRASKKLRDYKFSSKEYKNYFEYLISEALKNSADSLSFSLALIALPLRMNEYVSKVISIGNKEKKFKYVLSLKKSNSKLKKRRYENINDVFNKVNKKSPVSYFFFLSKNKLNETQEALDKYNEFVKNFTNNQFSLVDILNDGEVSFFQDMGVCNL